MPLHWEVVGASATVIPVGKASVNPTPWSDTTLSDGFVSVKVRVDMPLFGCPNALPMTGGSTTVGRAVLDGFPVPPSFEVTAPDVLLEKSPIVPVMLASTVQLPLAANEHPVKVIELLVLLTVPLHSETSGTLARVKLAGKFSVKPMPVSAPVVGSVLGLVMVKVKSEVPPAGIELGEKDLLIVGGEIKGVGFTVSVSHPSSALVCPSARSPVRVQCNSDSFQRLRRHSRQPRYHKLNSRSGFRPSK